MEGGSQKIGCTVNHCRYNDSKMCTLEKIKVAKCGGTKDPEQKEATMCDSYETE